MVEKVKLLKEEGFNISQISRMLNVSRSRIYKILDNKANTIGLDGLNVSLNNTQIELIIGSTLGDANIRSRNGRSVVRFCHSSKQYDYINFKYSILKSVSGKMSEYVRKNKLKDGSEYKDVSFSVRTMNELQLIYEKFYINGEKIVPFDITEMITNFAIAIWFMDDGWLSKKTNYYIATDSFDDESMHRLQSMFKVKYNISTSVNKRHELRILSDSTSKFEEIIKPYIINSMNYKLRSSR